MFEREKPPVNSDGALIRRDPEQPHLWRWWCPGCEEMHYFNDSWYLSMNGLKPTTSPSHKTQYVKTPNTPPETWTWNERPKGICDGAKEMVCHVFIKDGVIQYLEDCTHDLAGKFVPMEPVV